MRIPPLIEQIMAIRDELIASEETEQAAFQKLNQWTVNGKLQFKLAYEFFRPMKSKLTWLKLV